MRRGFLYLLISRLVWVASGFTIHIGLGRYLGPDLYGIFGITLSLISITYILFGSGIRQAVSKYIASEVCQAGAITRTGLRIQVVFAFVMTLVLLGLSGPISGLLGDERLSNLIKLSALTILPTGILFVYSGALEGVKQFGKSATISITYALLKILFVFLLVLLGFEVYGAVSGLILAIFFAALMGGYLCRGEASAGSFDSVVLIRFAVPVAAFFVAIALLMHIDILFAKSIMGDDMKIGFYTSAQALARVIYFVFAAFSVVLLPSISSATAKNDVELIQKHLKQSLRYMLILLVPTTLIISATSRELINLFYSSAYVSAAHPLRILVFGFAFLSVTLALSTIMQGYGAPRTPLVILLILIPLDSCLQVILISRFGLSGAALATTLTCLTGMVISCVWVYRLFGTLVEVRSMVNILFASAIVYLVALRFCLGGLFLPLCYLGLFVMYFGILLMIKEITKEDVSFIRSLFQRPRLRQDQIEITGG